MKKLLISFAVLLLLFAIFTFTSESQPATIVPITSRTNITNIVRGFIATNVGDGKLLKVSGTNIIGISTNEVSLPITNEIDGLIIVRTSDKVYLSATNIGNAQIAAAAAIARTKTASGTANHVLINDGTGIMSSEALLALSRGGTGTALTDPNGTYVSIWNDSANRFDWGLLGKGFKTVTITNIIHDGQADGEAFIIIGGQTSPTDNASLLTNAYTAAEAKTPHGYALSATNRYTIYCLPGQYLTVSGQILLDTQFIDIIGTGNNPGEVRLESSGITVRQTASDVHIQNLTIFSTVATPAASTDSHAYHPDTAMANTKCLNVWFRASNALAAMRTGISYSGWFEDCLCDVDGGFGHSISATASTAAGTFIRCLTKGRGFAALFSGSGVPTASGYFFDCKSSGGGFGMRGVASGIFINCTANQQFTTPLGTFSASSGGAFGGNDSAGTTATASGTFEYCRADGPAFGSGTGGGICSGNFRFCSSASADGFGGTSSGGSFTGTADYCYANGRGFGSGTSSSTFNGTARNCVFTSSSSGWTSFTGNPPKNLTAGVEDWDTVFQPNTADSATVSNTAVETNFSITESIAANHWRIAKAFEYVVYGKYSTDGAVPGTAQLKVKLGSVVLNDSGAITLNISKANAGWHIKGVFVCRTIGGSGTVSAGASFNIDGTVLADEVTVPSNGTKTIATTSAQTFQISVTMSAADLDNSFTLENLILKPLY